MMWNIAMIHRIIFLILFIALVSVNQCYCQDEYKSYDGFSVIRVVPKNRFQLRLLTKLKENENFKFWNTPAHVNTSVDIMVNENDKESLLKQLETNKIPNECAITDLGELIKEEKTTVRAGILDGFQRLNTIYNELASISSADSNFAAVETIGKSFEGRDIRIIRLGVNQNAKNKPIIWIDSGVHAREWIAPSTSLYIIDQLVKGYKSGDATIRSLVSTYDWYILPVFNVDGYEYTHTTDRLWRKNRARNANSQCRGVDINRNFDTLWGTTGISRDPCSEIYCGPRAFSELESQAFRNYILSIRARIKAFFTFHSYGQFFCYPPSGERKSAPNEATLDRLAQNGARQIANVYGTQFTVGTIARILYSASGSSMDWAYEKAGVNTAFVLEFRDKGRYGFVAPPSEIVPVGRETWEGVKRVVQDIGVRRFRRVQDNENDV